MSETENEFFFQDKRSSLDSLKTLLDSFKILFRNPRIFISIFTILLLPLSLLLFAFSLSSYSLKSEIYHLEALALASPTRFEARHLWKESRVDSLTLLRLKALFFVPSYVLSLLATITAVNSTALAYAGKRPNWETTVTAVRDTWKRPLVTSIFVYVIMLAYVHVPLTFSAFVGIPHARLFVAVLGVVFEVYLMAVLSLTMVVSVMEERFGWEAVKVHGCCDMDMAIYQLRGMMIRTGLVQFIVIIGGVY
ncbi:hypothetical protein HHK36_032243 [Tetracentron sinense]|uniref:Transmembrane protein n=1 Tax=Tetracentron sinense TaxID=13715 RepID=A0A834YB30_TETSI|nr:hypothetical protein HHK36_032243 [Tetracentron sinense]